MTFKVLLSRIVLLTAIFLPGAATAGETFVVTRTDDPAQNGCLVGDCSLREAVLAANTQSGLDLIELAAGTYSVASTIEITGDLIVYGVDASQTHIVASVELDPLLQLYEAATTYLVLRDLSIDALGGDEIDGRASATLVFEFVDAPNPGGSIYLSSGAGGGLVNISGSAIAGFMGSSGSRLAYLESSSFGDLQVLQNNVDVDNYQILISHVVIDGSARSNSGVRVGSRGAVRMVDVTMQNLAFGAQIESAPQLFEIDGLHYLNNREAMKVYAAGHVSFNRSTFHGNAPTSSGKPAALKVLAIGAHVVVDQSTFSNNTGTSETGGAVLVQGGAELLLRNSTFVDNTFTVAAAAANGRGAAIGYLSDPAETVLTLQNVTILSPASTPTGLQGSALGGRGGGADVLLNVFNSIFGGSCNLDGAAPDYAIGNVKTSGDSCGFGSGNLIGVSRADLALGSLADHGGPTPTLVPGPASVVIDAGSNLGCPVIDQRGIARPSGLRCDSGAIETGDVIFANGFN